MSAQIEVHYDGDETAEFWIEKPVLRLGSGEDCDVTIRSLGVAAHAATIQYRNGGYVIYNRADAPLTVADRTINPGGSEMWQDRETLRVAADVAVFLVIDGSAAPSHRARDDAVIQDYQQRRQAERAALKLQVQGPAATDLDAVSSGDGAVAKPSSNLQMLVGAASFLLALAMLAGILFMAFGPATSTSADPLADPSRVPSVLLQHKDQLPPALVLHLQEAQQAIERGDVPLARRRLERLRSKLVQIEADGEVLMVKQGDATLNGGEALTRYINHYFARLEQLNRSR